MLMGGQDELAIKLINSGHDPNQRCPRYQKPALMLTIQFEKPDIFQALLENGADIDCQPPPLSKGFYHEGFVVPLLELGCDLDHEKVVGYPIQFIKEDENIQAAIQTKLQSLASADSYMKA